MKRALIQDTLTCKGDLSCGKIVYRSCCIMVRINHCLASRLSVFPGASRSRQDSMYDAKASLTFRGERTLAFVLRVAVRWRSALRACDCTEVACSHQPAHNARCAPRAAVTCFVSSPDVVQYINNWPWTHASPDARWQLCASTTK